MAQWKRDVLYGIGLIMVAGFLFWETSDLPSGGIQYFVARSDVYVWMLLTFVVLLSIGIITSAIIKRDETPTPVIWNKLGVLTVVTVFIYLLVMEKIGFIISTVITVTFLTCLYSVRLGKFHKDTKKGNLIQFVKYLIFGVVVTVAVYYIFTAGLDVKLARFDLF
ncbi:MAG: tripartite tricarboxylate transporter TctB family protein [Firmicutes bacterium]|nr:tripartite tricarboxylate transporter TctB family protein [Bacillota bacterium]